MGANPGFAAAGAVTEYPAPLPAAGNTPQLMAQSFLAESPYARRRATLKAQRVRNEALPPPAAAMEEMEARAPAPAPRATSSLPPLAKIQPAYYPPATLASQPVDAGPALAAAYPPANLEPAAGSPAETPADTNEAMQGTREELALPSLSPAQPPILLPPPPMKEAGMPMPPSPDAAPPKALTLAPEPPAPADEARKAESAPPPSPPSALMQIAPPEPAPIKAAIGPDATLPQPTDLADGVITNASIQAKKTKEAPPDANAALPEKSEAGDPASAQAPAQGNHTPPVTASATQAAEASTLSKESKAILGKLPSQMDKPKIAAKEGGKHIDIERAKITEEMFGDMEISAHEDDGMKIEVKKQDASASYQLEKAYNALVAGMPEIAIGIYKEILGQEPENKAALFGLATTYHRVGQLKLARPLYGKLLGIDPDNREAVSNFLALVSEESPSEAADQLENLQRKNPDFSPIPAQLAVIYDKMGDRANAKTAMQRAVQLSPENITYRYNLAVLMDKYGERDEAISLYKQLLSSSEKGEMLPGNPEKIQERLTFLGSNRS